VKVFTQQNKILRYEEATLVRDLLVRIHEATTNTNTIFLSHKWLTSWHPDDRDNTKFNQILRLLCRSNLREIEYVWIDYSCVPQDNDSDKEKAINSFADYVQMCTHFVILVGNEGPRTLTEYNKRGWCRLERFAARTPAAGRFLLHIFVHNGSDDTFSEALSVPGAIPTEFAEINPLEGKFSGDSQDEIIRIAPALLNLCTKIKLCPRDDNHSKQAAYITNSLFQPIRDEQRTEDLKQVEQKYNLLFHERMLQKQINEMKASKPKPRKSRRQIEQALIRSESLRSIDNDFDGSSLRNKSEQVLLQELEQSRLIEKLTTASGVETNPLFDWVTAFDGNVPMSFDAFTSFLITQSSSYLSPFVASGLFDTLLGSGLLNALKGVGSETGLDKWTQPQQYVAVANRVCAVGATAIPFVSAGIFNLLRKDILEGTISRHEFMVVLLVVLRALDVLIQPGSLTTSDMLSTLLTVFEMVDADEDGKIDVEETEQFFSNLLRMLAKIPQSIALELLKVSKSASLDDPLYEFFHMLANVVIITALSDDSRSGSFGVNQTIQVQKLAQALSSIMPDIPTELKQELLRIYLDRATHGSVSIQDAAEACTRKLYDMIANGLKIAHDKFLEGISSQEIKTIMAEEWVMVGRLVWSHFHSYLKGPGLRKALKAVISSLDLMNTGFVQQSVIDVLLSKELPSLRVHICEFFSVFEKGKGEVIEAQELVDVLHKMMGKIFELTCDVCFIFDDLIQVIRAVLVPILSFVANVGDGTSASFTELCLLRKFLDSATDPSELDEFFKEKKQKEEEALKIYQNQL